MSIKIDKYIIYIVAVICVLFCISLSIVLLYKKIVPYNKVNASDVILTEGVKNNKIVTKLAVSDKFGKNIKESSSSYVFYEFEVKNISDINHDYEIYMIKDDIDSNKELSIDYIKIYLTDDSNAPLGIFNSNIIPTYRSLNYIEDKPSSKIIYNGKLNKSESKRFILRVWIADNYVINSDAKEFSFSLGVRAI